MSGRRENDCGNIAKGEGEMEEYYRKKDEGVKDSVVGHK
jgi:hypothetical protein